jgi:hypothetical protein
VTIFAISSFDLTGQTLVSGLVQAKENPRYLCPDINVDSTDNDIDDLHDVMPWQDYGTYYIFV